MLRKIFSALCATILGSSLAYAGAVPEPQDTCVNGGIMYKKVEEIKTASAVPNVPLIEDVLIDVVQVMGPPKNMGEACDEFTGSTQNGAMSGGVGTNAQNRLGSGENAFLPNFLSVTQGAGSGFNAWIAAEYHKFNGATSGHSSEFVFGIDTNIGPSAILGLTVGVENMDFDNNVRVESVAFGPYLAYDFGAGIFDLLITKSDPEYTALITSNGDRISAAANISFNPIGTGMGMIHPFINISGYNEDIANGVPPVVVEERRGIAGFTYDFATQGNAQPYLLAAIDSRSVTNSVTGTDSYTKPQVGLGINSAFQGGTFSAEVNYGHLNSQTRDINGQIRIDFSF